MESTEAHLREGTQIELMEIAFVFNRGGLGDFIHWTPAIQYAIETNPHLSGLVCAPAYFAPLAELWFSPYRSRFEVHVYKEAELNSDPRIKGVKRRAQSKYDALTAAHWHLGRVGFGTYAYIDEIPEDWECLPTIRGNEVDLHPFYLPNEYIVITTEATSETRRLPAKTINDIVNWVYNKKYTPIFLGKKELEGMYQSKHSNGIHTFGVKDLREQTTITEAACVLANAKAVVGLDNGLLHLASCSKVPVVAAYTTVDPRLRTPVRQIGARTVNIVPSEELKCRFCQSNVRFIEHDFRTCLYGDTLCCTGLTAAPFIEALERILEEE